MNVILIQKRGLVVTLRPIDSKGNWILPYVGIVCYGKTQIKTGRELLAREGIEGKFKWIID